MSIAMATKELSIGFAELSRLEIYCAKCEAALLIDVEKTQGFGRVEQCAVCGEKLSDKTKAAIAAYSRFFNETKESKSRIDFRLAVE